MNPSLSNRITGVTDPVIAVMGDLIEANPETISMGQGVVFYPPPLQIWDKIDVFRAQPSNHIYQEVDGIPQLRSALVQKVQQDNQIDCCHREVIVTAGSNMAFLHAILAIADPGDEVLLISPYFFNHEMALRLANVNPVVVPADADYLPDLDALRAAITPRTRALVTVSPNNPTGAVYSEPILRAVNTLCAEQGLYHISDEAYEYFTYGSQPHYSPAAGHGTERHTISLFSFSKSYGFASWRIGYMLVPRHLYRPLLRIQDTNPICPPVISQFAALGLLECGADYTRTHLTALMHARDYCLQALHQHRDDLEVAPASGAFYLYIKLLTGGDSMQIARTLIATHKIAVIPGMAFGDVSHCTFRLSYGALDPDNLAEGMERFLRGLQSQIA